MGSAHDPGSGTSSSKVMAAGRSSMGRGSVARFSWANSGNDWSVMGLMDAPPSVVEKLDDHLFEITGE